MGKLDNIKGAIMPLTVAAAMAGCAPTLSSTILDGKNGQTDQFAVAKEITSNTHAALARCHLGKLLSVAGETQIVITSPTPAKAECIDRVLTKTHGSIEKAGSKYGMKCAQQFFNDNTVSPPKIYIDTICNLADTNGNLAQTTAKSVD